MKRKYVFFLKDIIESIDSIMDFTKGMEYEDFIKDDKTFSAVIRKIEII